MSDTASMNPEHLLKPSPGRIAVEPFDEPTRTSSGLYLPPSNKQATVGRVVAVCEPYTKDGEEFEPIFRVGTIVCFGQFIGTVVQIERRSFILLREIDVLAELLTQVNYVSVDPD